MFLEGKSKSTKVTSNHINISHQDILQHYSKSLQGDSYRGYRWRYEEILISKEIGYQGT